MMGLKLAPLEKHKTNEHGYSPLKINGGELASPLNMVFLQFFLFGISKWHSSFKNHLIHFHYELVVESF